MVKANNRVKPKAPSDVATGYRGVGQAGWLGGFLLDIIYITEGGPQPPKNLLYTIQVATRELL